MLAVQDDLPPEIQMTEVVMRGELATVPEQDRAHGARAFQPRIEGQHPWIGGRFGRHVVSERPVLLVVENGGDDPGFGLKCCQRLRRRLGVAEDECGPTVPTDHFGQGR